MNREQIGGFVKAARLEQGYSQDGLAEKAQVRRQTLSDIENNKLNYGIDTLIIVLTVLGYEILPQKKLRKVLTSEKVQFDFSKIQSAKPEDEHDTVST